MNSFKKLAKLLRTQESVIVDIDKKMSEIFGHQGVVDDIVEQNENNVREKLIKLGFGKEKNPLQVDAEKVFEALIDKVRELDAALQKRFYGPKLSTISGCRSMLNAAKELAGNMSGFFLKEEKARELFRFNPPKKIMALMGYGNDVDKMLAKEDIYEIFAALRFVEDGEWMNNVFFQPYKDVRASDFEQREIKVMALPERWAGVGEEFLNKKLHHMSHLKEMGLVYVIPVKKQLAGDVLYLFFMSLHYLYEVDWYARLFKSYSQDKEFVKDMITALKVEASNKPLPQGRKAAWRVMPGYLAKKDINDPRLSEPHVNAESWHYDRAAESIRRYAKRFAELGLDFFNDMETACEFFKDAQGQEQIVSFDLFDNGISLLQQAGFNKRFFYHQQEALWNKLFTSYVGREKLDQLMMDRLDEGFITL